ncbi:MAG TPA: thioredoxin family protein [Burkholderiales bacterium]|nr:thioredoxin family protein [Burkholderiales bacterium]
MIRFLLCLLLCLGAWRAGAATVVTTPQVRAEALAYAPHGIAAGKPLWLGLWLQHQPHWHTYWRNPGDSGLPTVMNWELPLGFKAGVIDWPTPKRLPFGSLMNYGYEGQVLLPVAVEMPADFKGETLKVKLRADWLVCKVECIPESGDFELNLPTTGKPVVEHAQRFIQSFNARPLQSAAATQAKIEGQQFNIEVKGLPAAVRGRAPQIFPESPGVFEHAISPRYSWVGDTLKASLTLSPLRSASPDRVPTVLVFDSHSGALRVEAKVLTPWPQPIEAQIQSVPMPPTPMATAVVDTGAPGFAFALLLAFGGGLLLNLMPCVFPVLSLKLLGFARHANERMRLIGGGLAYTAGVLLSFMALAALLLALRGAGAQLGWGFQLQEPGFVASLAVLFTLIALNLVGVFELRGLVPSHLAGWQIAHPILDAFFTGILAVVIASPCTAPFMGAALGLAISLPATQALAIFVALGLGMASPYLIASVVPGIARAFPHPGPWLQRFKMLMAFPMFATVVWLLWVLGRQVGVDVVSAMLALLLVLGFAIWVWSSPLIAGRIRFWFGVPALLLLGATFAWAVPLLDTNKKIEAQVEAGWEDWSAERVAAYRAEGRPVFVDFTAAWCITCQYNKRATLANAEVLGAFKQKNVALLRADWTSRDPHISAALTSLGRSGVPVYALYAGRAEVHLLSELPSVDELKAALAKL